MSNKGGKQLVIGLAILLVLVPTTLFAESVSAIDTLSQPNGVQIRCHAWKTEITGLAGMPYDWHVETLLGFGITGGYAIIENAVDHYWYYATLGPNGDYVPSSYKVGINQPIGIPLHLQRGEPIASQINERIEAFNQECLEQYGQYKSSYGGGDRETVIMGVICVEFSDVGPNHRQCLHKTTPNEYTWDNFYLSLGSYNIYNSVPNGFYSPDGDSVYGSMKDYWDEVSFGNVTFETTLINPVIAGHIQWLNYPNNVAESSAQNWGQNTTVLNWATDLAADSGWIPPNVQYIAVVGAGVQWYYQEGLGWHIIGPVGGIAMPSFSYTQNGLNIEGGFAAFERWDYWGVWYTNPTLPGRYFPGSVPPHTFNFDNIGLYCHEAGHAVFGMGHWVPDSDEWDLMISGTCAGPGYACSCPTPPSPPIILAMGWKEPTMITENTIALELGYYPDYNLPEIFLVEGTQSANPFQDWFTLVNIRYQGWYRYAPGNPREPGYGPEPNPANNLGIWHNAGDPRLGQFGYAHMQKANNAWTAYMPNMYVFPGLTGRTEMLPTYADTLIHDTRSCPQSYSSNPYLGRNDGCYQDGLAVTNIIQEWFDNNISANVYRNFWSGTLDDAPGGVQAPPEQFTNWFGEDVVVAGDVTLASYQTLNIQDSSTVACVNGAKIISQGSTMIWTNTLASDFNIEGNVEFNVTTTVSSNAKLTFYPESTVKFAEASQLIVYGWLKADGESGAVINFEPLAESWEGIYVSHTGFVFPSPLVLNYCRIVNARCAVKTQLVQNLSITNCEIFDNELGIYFLGSTSQQYPGLTISANQVYLNSRCGLAVFNLGNTTGQMAGNEIWGNAAAGVFLLNSSPQNFSENAIYGNGLGVSCLGNANPHVQNCNIMFNAGHGVSIDTQANPNLTGGNNIFANDGFELNNTCRDTILAENNWWGVSNPSQSPDRFFLHPSLVDYSPWSVGPNGDGCDQEPPNLPEEPFVCSSGQTDAMAALDLFLAALSAKYEDGEPLVAKGLFQKIAGEYPGYELATVAEYELGSSVLLTQVESDETVSQPTEFQCYPCYPNPFNPSTTLRFYLVQASLVNVEVYNVTGQKLITLVDGVESAGEHRVNWNTEGLNLPSGLYLCRVKALSVDANDRNEKILKVLLLK